MNETSELTALKATLQDIYLGIKTAPQAKTDFLEKLANYVAKNGTLAVPVVLHMLLQILVEPEEFKITFSHQLDRLKIFLEQCRKILHERGEEKNEVLENLYQEIIFEDSKSDMKTDDINKWLETFKDLNNKPMGFYQKRNFIYQGIKYFFQMYEKNNQEGSNVVSILGENLKTLLELEYHDTPLQEKGNLKGQSVLEEENRFIEFKNVFLKDNTPRSDRERVLKALNAFKNSGGGFLFIGINDQGNIVGEIQNEVTKTREKIKNHLGQMGVAKSYLDSNENIGPLKRDDILEEMYILRINIPKKENDEGYYWIDDMNNYYFFIRIDGRNVKISLETETGFKKYIKELQQQGSPNLLNYSGTKLTLKSKKESSKIILEELLNNDKLKNLHEKRGVLEKEISRFWTMETRKKPLQDREFFIRNEEVSGPDLKNAYISRLENADHPITLLRQTILALMNSKGGRIYYGIKENRVEGIRVDRSQKDKLKREIVKDLVDNLKFPLFLPEIFLFYIPVLNEEFRKHTNEFVLKIQVQQNRIWYRQDVNNRYYKRYNGENQVFYPKIDSRWVCSEREPIDCDIDLSPNDP